MDLGVLFQRLHEPATRGRVAADSRHAGLQPAVLDKLLLDTGKELFEVVDELPKRRAGDVNLTDVPGIFTQVEWV